MPKYNIYNHDERFVSIIMNCYNGEKYLRQAIESILSQSYRNWEVIFWDNQSIDNSANIFKSYHDPRFHYYYAEKHTVLYEARNYALLKCRGDLIAFLDVDDWWAPEKLQIQVPLFNDDNVGISCGNYILVNERKKNDTSQRVAYQAVPFGNVLNDLFDDYFVHISSLIVRKKTIEHLAYPFDKRFNILGDFDFLVRLSAEWKMASVQLPISYYRWHQNNTGYKTNLLISDELNIWYDESKDNPTYKNQLKFAKFEAKIKLYNVLKLLYRGGKREAFRYISNLPIQQKIKTIIALLLPTVIVRKWIDRS